MIPRELKVQETAELEDQLGQEEAGNGTYIPTYIHNLFGEAGYKWDRLNKKSWRGPAISEGCMRCIF